MLLDDVLQGWARLHDAHALALQAGGREIRMANPFSAGRTAHRVLADGPIGIAVQDMRPDDPTLLFHCLVPARRW